MSIMSKHEDLAVKIKNTEDVLPVANILRKLEEDAYAKGYCAGCVDTRRSRLAAQKTAEREFREELDTIDDVMSSPFDIDHQ